MEEESLAGSLRGAEGGTPCYQIAVLASVPRLLRGVVVRGIKKDMAAGEQRSFLPIFEKEKEWKKGAGFAEPDDAYVCVCHARVKWSGRHTEQLLRSGSRVC